MMELFEALKSRRSIRKFKDQPLSDEQIHKLLEAVKWAPSWSNTQTWEVITVTESDMKEKLAGMLVYNPATKAMTQAPVIFIMCAKLKSSGYYKNEPTTNKGDWFMFDSGLATQNLVLTAHDMGLGSVIVGLFDAEKAEKYLDVPDGYAVVAFVPVGYPDKDPKAPPRREPEEFLHKERW